jgi:hypothetical protein
MAKTFPEISAEHQAFIAAQKIFFVGSAAREGRVNLSPKGLDTFRVLSPRSAGYLDSTGSGNETAAHLAENGRVTFMFCAFAGPPMILRLYGRGRVVFPHSPDWPALRPRFGDPLPGERQLIVAEIDRVQTSCGFAVPFFAPTGPRTVLTDYWTKKDPAALANYWAEKNTRSIDGLPTHIPTP